MRASVSSLAMRASVPCVSNGTPSVAVSRAEDGFVDLRAHGLEGSQPHAASVAIKNLPPRCSPSRPRRASPPPRRRRGPPPPLSPPDSPAANRLAPPPRVSPPLAALEPRRRAAAAAAAKAKAASLYEVLRVERTASPTEIKGAYRTLAKLYHPDALRRVEAGSEDGRDFLEIHDAYATLSDPSARALYDLSLGPHQRRRPASGGAAWCCPTRRWETDQCW
ncbi:hypothetical protein NL676_027576 [Syzygium grande]|nr:hypothetical protein NL676_027576 [Syzygium grande]